MVLLIQQSNFNGIIIAKFKDEKLIEEWNGIDFLPMYQQLGYELTLKHEQH